MAKGKRVWIDKDAHEKLSEFCEEKGASKKGIVSEAIRRFLKNRDKESV